MTAPVAASGPVRLTPPLTRPRLVLRLTLVGYLAATVWAWRYLGLSPAAALDGIGSTRDLLERMLPPNFSRASTALELLFETLWMAVIGTVIATLLSIPLAFGAARNTTPHALVRYGCRMIITATRAIPDLVFAMIFARVFGARGAVLAGVLALGLHSIGMLGKLFADAIEQIDEQPREAVASVGARKWSTIMTSVVPQVLPSFIGTALYRLDINIRSASILGFVGAGGIGLLLRELTGQLLYDRLLGVIVIMLVFLFLIEALSAGIRSALFGSGSTPVAGGAKRRRWSVPLVRGMMPAARREPTDATVTAAGTTASATSGRRRLTPPWTRQRKVNTSYQFAVVVLVAMAFVFTWLNPLDIVGAVPDIWNTATRMFPPDFTTAREDIITGMTETIAIGIVATFLSVFIALPIGLLAARNTTANRGVYFVSRIAMLICRGLPELVLAVIFIVMFKPGAMPGIAALAVGIGAGFLAKLYADSIEEIDASPREAVTATGASRPQEIATSVLPQALPALVGNTLYVLDINIRAATILGIVGAGGIGFLLQSSLQNPRHWPTGAAIIISIFVTVSAIEMLSSWIRKQIL